jgi:hypothetical protein
VSTKDIPAIHDHRRRRRRHFLSEKFFEDGFQIYYNTP